MKITRNELRQLVLEQIKQDDNYSPEKPFGNVLFGQDRKLPTPEGEPDTKDEYLLRNSLKTHIARNQRLSIYHGTPFEKSATGIKNNGLQQVGDFIVSGGDGSPSMNNRSYVAKDLWNAIRYSFMKPSSFNLEWDDYVRKHPYGYVFQFNIALNELLPDEDAIGAMVNEFLNKNENNFLSKYLNNISKDLLNKVKEGSFDAFAEIGKIIEPNLSNEDKKNIVLQSRTATVAKPIKSTKSFKIRKPNTQFLKNANDYVDWFNKNKQIF